MLAAQAAAKTSRKGNNCLAAARIRLRAQRGVRRGQRLGRAERAGAARVAAEVMRLAADRSRQPGQQRLGDRECGHRAQLPQIPRPPRRAAGCASSAPVVVDQHAGPDRSGRERASTDSRGWLSSSIAAPEPSPSRDGVAHGRGEQTFTPGPLRPQERRDVAGRHRRLATARARRPGRVAQRDARPRTRVGKPIRLAGLDAPSAAMMSPIVPDSRSNAAAGSPPTSAIVASQAVYVQRGLVRFAAGARTPSRPGARRGPCASPRTAASSASSRWSGSAPGRSWAAPSSSTPSRSRSSHAPVYSHTRIRLDAATLS